MRGAPLGASPVVREDVEEVALAPLPWEALRGRTVLVTGASGMLPACATLALLRASDLHGLGVRVLALVRREGVAMEVLADVLERGDVRLVVQDVAADLGGLADEGIDVVLHGASPARPSLHASDPVGSIRANVQGTLNVMDLAARSGSSDVLLMSSAEVYGQQPPGIDLVGEDDYGGLNCALPRSCYSEGKRAAESIAVAYSVQHGMRAHLTRFGHIYGPGMRLDDGRVQAEFTRSVMDGQDIVLNSDGSSVRTYTYVADAVSGLFTALLVGEGGPVNVADSGGRTTIRELAENFVAARPDKGLRVRFAEDVVVPEGMFSAATGQGLDDTRLRALGWSPRSDLPTGIDRTLRHHEWDQD